MTYEIDTDWRQGYYLDIREGLPESLPTGEYLGTISASLRPDAEDLYEFMGISWRRTLYFFKDVYWDAPPEYSARIHGVMEVNLTEEQVPQEILDAFDKEW